MDLGLHWQWSLIQQHASSVFFWRLQMDNVKKHRSCALCLKLSFHLLGSLHRVGHLGMTATFELDHTKFQRRRPTSCNETSILVFACGGLTLPSAQIASLLTLSIHTGGLRNQQILLSGGLRLGWHNLVWANFAILTNIFSFGCALEKQKSSYNNPKVSRATHTQPCDREAPSRGARRQ